MMHALVGEGGEAGATSTAAAATADGIMHVDSPDASVAASAAGSAVPGSDADTVEGISALPSARAPGAARESSVIWTSDRDAVFS